MIKLTLDPNGDTITASLTQYMGPERFTLYRDACAAVGARYVAAGRCNRAPVDAAPALMRELTARKLPVDVDPALATRLRQAATEAQALLEAGRTRTVAAEARLAGQGLRLFPYQRTGVEWLAPRTRALLADDMGLGKTVQALIAMPENAAALVVLPAVVKFNWEAEVRRWRPDLRPVVIASTSQFRWPSPGEVVLVTYGMLPGDAVYDEQPVLDADGLPVMNSKTGKPKVKRTLIEVTLDMPPAPVGMVLVADEAHALKTRKALRTQKWKALKQHVLASQGWLWGITGTPLENRPPELWAVLEAFGLAQEAFGPWPNFVRLFNGRKGAWGGMDWGRPEDQVPDLLRKVMLHRRRVEVLPELPAKTHQELIVGGLDARTLALCDEVLAVLKAKGIDLEDVTETVDTTKAQGAAFELMSRARAALATAKIPSMLEVVEEHEEAGEPLVVFSDHRAPVDVLASRKGWAVITGDTSAEDRQRYRDAFQAGTLKGIAGTIKAMGVGVTLTRAHRLLMVDQPWTPAKICQAEDRVCRIGQTRGVVIIRLVANHALDERVSALLAEKAAIIEASVQASAVEADYLGASPAEELAQAAGAAAAAVAEAEEESRQLDQAIADTFRFDAVQRLGRMFDGRKDLVVDGKFRGPANPLEDHAKQALLQLAAMDQDRAREENGVGFSRDDGTFGHSLAQRLESHGTLSDKQWEHACKFARKYRRQVGEPPAWSPVNQGSRRAWA